MYAKMFDVVFLHQPSRLNYSQTAEHFPKLIQCHKIWVTGKIVFIELSFFHIAISLSKKLSLRMQADITSVLLGVAGSGRTSLLTSLQSHVGGHKQVQIISAVKFVNFVCFF